MQRNIPILSWDSFLNHVCRRQINSFIALQVDRLILSRENIVRFDTLGVHLSHTDDQLGQQYVTPRQAIDGRGADILIVGRAILDSINRVKTAQEYQEEGYRVYAELRQH